MDAALSFQVQVDSVFERCMDGGNVPPARK